MSFIDRVRAFLAPTEAKASAVAPLFARYGVGQPKYMPDNLTAYSKEGYGKNAVVFRCISILAKNLATIPWQLMDGDGTDAKEIENKKHPLLALLKRPNPNQGGSAFFEAVAAYLLLHGNSYIEGVSGSNDDGSIGRVPKELYTHRPDRMKVIPHHLIANMAGEYLFEYNGGQKKWKMDPVMGLGPILHWKTFNPTDDWYGQGVIKAAATSVDQHNAAGDWNAGMLQNGAAPAGGFKYAPAQGVGGSLTKEQRVQIQKDIEERLAGPVNARRPLILDGGLEWMEIGLSPKEMDWLEGKKASAMDICAVFGVPGQVYGIPDAQTFANYAEARLAMYEEAVLPLLDSLVDELEHWLVPLFGDTLVLRPDLDKVDALALKRAQQWERVAKADWLTLNEKREATNYDRLEDPMADEVLVDAGKVPLSMSATEGDQAAPEDGAVDADGNPLPGAPADGAPLPPVDGSGNAAPADGVQAAGLNGTQITALQSILDDVATGQMSPEAAIIMIMLAFPTFDEAQVLEMVNAQDEFEPTPPPAPVGPDGEPVVPGATPSDSGGKPKPGQPAKPGKKPPKGPSSNPAKSDADVLVGELIELGFKDDSAQALARLAYGDAE